MSFEGFYSSECGITICRTRPSLLYRRFRHSTTGKCAFLPFRPSHQVATDLPPLTPYIIRAPEKHRKSCRFFLCRRFLCPLSPKSAYPCQYLPIPA